MVRQGFSVTKVSATTTSAASIQSFAAVPLKKKAVAMNAKAHSSDQAMGDRRKSVKAGFMGDDSTTPEEVMPR